MKMRRRGEQTVDGEGAMVEVGDAESVMVGERKERWKEEGAIERFEDGHVPVHRNLLFHLFQYE